MSKKTIDINQLEEGFQELQQYSDTQFKLVLELKGTIARLESENKSLKTLLEQNLPAISLQVSDLGFGISSEQLICETQILLLKDLAVTRQLTMEESKKFQIFEEILSKYKSNKKEDPFSVSKMTDEELLKAAQSDVRN